MSDPNDIESVFKRAAEIASLVPDHLQEAAFNRAVDALMAEAVGDGRTNAASDSDTPPRHPSPDEDLGKLLVGSVNATEHPKIRAASSVLDRALAVLHAARVTHHIDGLTPTEITTVLTEKFRISTRTLSVSDALGKVAGDLVDRVKEGRGYRYRIMEAGEKHLASPPSAKPVDTKPTSTTSGTKRRTPGKTKSDSEAKKKVGNRTSAGRPGPKKILGQLIDQGYFTTPRVISDVISHLVETRGRRYRATDLSPALVRLLREGRLSREKNADGQYEYTSE